MIGLVGPASDLDRAPEQWRPYAPRLVCAAASPYGPASEITAAGSALVAAGADLIYLDDMGFSDEHRVMLAAFTGLPVLCATTLTARVLCEIV